MLWFFDGLIWLAMVFRHLNAILTFVFLNSDLAYPWGNVGECYPSSVFVLASVHCGVLSFLFYLFFLVFSFCCRWESVLLGNVLNCCPFSVSFFCVEW